MSTRRCPICQTVAAPLTDADGRQFCTSCDLQLPPENHTPAAPPRASRQERDPDPDDRPRARPTKTVTAHRPEPSRPARSAADGAGGRVIVSAVLLVGAFFLLALFFGGVIWWKTMPGTPTTRPAMGTMYRPGGGRNLDPWDQPPDFDRWDRAAPTSKW